MMHERVKQRFERIDAFIEKIQNKFEKLDIEEKTSVDLLGKIVDMQKDIADITKNEAKAWYYLRKEHVEDENI